MIFYSSMNTLTVFVIPRLNAVNLNLWEKVGMRVFFGLSF
jgi:hypothetical protein